MMIATQCPSAEELRALSTGRLADERSDALLEHVRECEACRSALETVADGEDSLIASLRTPDALASFDAEPGCKLAMAKALGALASTTEQPTDADRGYLPKTIGEYEIVRPLGSGGMGTVFLARHTKLGREVALKVLAGHRLGDPRMRDRFEAEMRAVGRLSHPNIVTAHDAREVDGTAVLVTEYIDGFDLGQLVARTGPIPVADACEIVRQVAIALAYTSQQGFVHRDVKPSNIMLSRSGEVKLLDLGLARFQLEDFEQIGMTGTGQTMGTADYVAPEQVADSRSVDVRADIYSLGCTLFKLLCGVPPFADAKHATAFAKMTAHVSEPAPSLAERVPNAPAGLLKLIASMLAKEPPKRPQSPQAIAERLAPFAQGSDLERLVVRASDLDPVRTLPAATSRPGSPAALPLFHRPISLWIALASGIAGILLAIVLGIVVQIEYPDGTSVSLEVPSGSKVTMAELPEGKPDDSAARAGITDGPIAASAASNSSTLQIAILVEKEDLDEDALKAAREKLMESKPPRLEMEEMGMGMGMMGMEIKHPAPVVTDVGTWYPLSPATYPATPPGGMSGTAQMAQMPPGPLVPISWTHQGQRYVLARNDREGVIGWDEIEGHLSMTAPKPNGETQIELNFDKELFAKITDLTKNNLQRHMAIILDNEIITAPRVLSGIRSSRTILSGDFTEPQIERLRAALGGPLVKPRPEAPVTRVTETAASDSAKALQGLWQVTEISVQSDEQLPRTELVWAFKGPSYYICSSHFPMGGGTFWVSKESPANSHSSIEFRDELPRDKLLPNPRGMYLVHGGHQVSMALNLMLHDLSTSNVAVENLDRPSIRYHLNRLGMVPRTSEEADAIAEGKSEDLAAAIMTMFDMMQVPPRSLDPPNVDRVQAAAKQHQTRENLLMLGRAFHRFHDKHKKLPGSLNKLEGAITPPSGKPIHPFSWRVAILPHIGENELHRQYRFDEPWDSEHNRALLSKMPAVYRSPYASDSAKPDAAGETHYQGFVGEQTALGAADGVRFRDFLDGTANTLLIVESRATVPWTKPQDLPFEKPEDAKSIKPFDNVPLNFLTVYGAVHEMNPVDGEKLAKLIIRNGGEPDQL